MQIKNRKIKGIIFDLDGTLVDSIEDITDAMNRVLSSQGFPLHSVDDYKYFVGKGLRELIIEALPKQNRSEETIEKCFDLMREDYGKNYLVKTKAYKGVNDLLDSLKEMNIKMSVLSNKVDEMTKQVVKEIFGGNTFDIVLGKTSRFPRKPDPAGALFISKQMGIDPENMAYLGDTNTDMETARNAHMLAIGALWGFRTKEELLQHGAEIVIEHPMDLIANLHKK